MPKRFDNRQRRLAEWYLRLAKSDNLVATIKWKREEVGYGVGRSCQAAIHGNMVNQGHSPGIRRSQLDANMCRCLRRNRFAIPSDLPPSQTVSGAGRLSPSLDVSKNISNGGSTLTLHCSDLW